MTLEPRPRAHEMSAESMSRAVVHTNLSETDFGVPEIYQKVPFEDEDDELCLGHTTCDVYEGEDTCEEEMIFFGVSIKSREKK